MGAVSSRAGTLMSLGVTIATLAMVVVCALSSPAPVGAQDGGDVAAIRQHLQQMNETLADLTTRYQSGDLLPSTLAGRLTLLHEDKLKAISDFPHLFGHTLLLWYVNLAAMDDAIASMFRVTYDPDPRDKLRHWFEDAVFSLNVIDNFLQAAPQDAQTRELLERINKMRKLFIKLADELRSERIDRGKVRRILLELEDRKYGLIDVFPKMFDHSFAFYYHLVKDLDELLSRAAAEAVDGQTPKEKVLQTLQKAEQRKRRIEFSLPTR